MRFFSILIFFICWVSLGNAQSVHSSIRFKDYSLENCHFKLYDFTRQSNIIKAKYFAQNAYQQFLNWKGNKEILLIAAGAFSDSWEANAIPVGLCIDNGTVVNRSPDNLMDGLVIVYNGSSQEGGIAVVDLSKKPVSVLNDGKYVSYNPRSSTTDRISFLNWGERQGLTLFQTQLLYSSDNKTKVYDQDRGYARERRFLAICTKSGVIHHIILDTQDEVKLNKGCSLAKRILEYDGFDVLYILNLDVGDKDLLYVHDGTELRDLRPNSTKTAKIGVATNLIIYYK